ncbi:arginine/serine-rich protein PNISR [Drosophila takahashii]|uniref:arginine/serine-rich protein PNISR n=1 Tax=Drosophila takahashii TaxID=29030 RepID=UPI001CF9145A|nr:arginine/serine-rich protein PNISR [Drosophila takahashii]
MFPGGNGNADLGYNKHAHAHVHGHGQHGHGHNHNHNPNQFLAQPPPPPTHFPLPPGGGQGMVTPLVAAGLPLAMQGGANIDWAQLAQQWIHMRDASPMAMPVAPPPPIIGNVREYHQQALAMPMPSVVRAGFPILEEHGEADMDMDDENERGHGAETPPPPAPAVTQSQWLAASEAPGQATDASGGAAVTLGKQPWNSWPTQSGKSIGNPTSHIPSLLKLNVSNPNEPQQQLQLQLQAQQQQQPTHPQAHQPQPHPHHLTPHAHQPQQQAQQQQESGSGSASSEIDANKRKMLPAWIREGLEKMEREKQRQLERQQSSVGTPDDEVNHVKQVSSKTLTTPVNLLNIANVASDSEDSIGLPVEARGELKDQQIGNELISKAGDISSGEEQEEEEEQRGAIDPSGNRAAAAEATENDVNGKNYEERLADLMLVVRRTLTEILLETTNEEIAAIAGETLKAHRAKASSAQVIRKSALSSITGNLGLAAYGDSSSESEEDEDDEDGERQGEAARDADKSVQLSAEELKARIRRSKRSFERVIDDIEDRVAKQELRDEQTLQRHRKRELERSEAGANEHRRPLVNAEPPGELASQVTHEKLQQFNGKRPSRKERTTRFSDNKDGKQQSQSYVQQVVAAANVAPLSSLSCSTGSQKLKPVPNPATNLLQMPESVATMLSAADKALHKANKSSSRKSKSKRRRHSSTSSSSSSSSGSSSSSDSEDSSSSSGSKTSSSRSKRASRHGHRRSHGSSRSKYERRDRDRERERERGRDRDRDRERDRGHRQHRSSGGHRQRSSRRHRDSSHSGGDEGGSSSYQRSSRQQSSSRSHDHGSSSGGRKRHRTRSRSKSRSTHHSSSNAYSSTSSASHSRKRH